MPEQEKKFTEAVEGKNNLESEETKNKYERLINENRDTVAKIYDGALASGINPVELALDQSYEGAKEIYGEERINRIIEEIRQLDPKNREDFIDRMMLIIEPLVRDKVYNPEIRAKAEEVEEKNKPEVVYFGKLEGHIRPAEWEFELSDGVKISKKDLVMEISWPEEEKTIRIKGIISSFREMADFLKKREKIKAVTGVSWMMSRELTDSLGFEKFRQINIAEERKTKILDLARSARMDKPYRSEVNSADVVLGAISREQFMKKYG